MSMFDKNPKDGIFNTTPMWGAGTGNYNQYADETRKAGFGAQQNALGMYADAAAGKGPSVAEMQMRQGLEQAQRQSLQAGTMGRGGNLAGQQQAAISAGAGQAAMANQAGAQLRAQEMQANRAAYADLGSQMYGQGLAYDSLMSQDATANKGIGLDYYLGKRQLDMQAQQNRWARGMGVANAAIGAVSAIGDVVGGAMKSDERQKIGVRPTNPYAGATINPFRDGQTVDPFEEEFAKTTANSKGGEIAAKMGMKPRADGGFEVDSGAMPGGGRAPAGAAPAAAGGISDEEFDGMSGFSKLGWAGSQMSDERVKQNVGQPAPTPQDPYSATATISSTTPVTFEYAPGAGPPGRRTGVMAQDLERTPAGAAIVQDTPQGKMVDGAGAATLALAGQAEALQREQDMQRRLEALERGQTAQPVSNVSPSFTNAQVRERKSRTLPTGETLPSSNEKARMGATHNRIYNSPAADPLLNRMSKRMDNDDALGLQTDQEKAIYDAFWDEMDKWTYVDEATGQRKIGATRLDLNTVPRGMQRYMDGEEAKDVAVRKAKEKKNATAKAKPRMI